MTNEQLLQKTIDFLSDLSGYVHMEYEPYGNGRQYPVVDEEQLIADLKNYIGEL